MPTSRRLCTRWIIHTGWITCLIFWLPAAESAATAATKYTMDLSSDCIAAGYLDIPRDQVTTLSAPSKDVTSGRQTVNCLLQFTPQTDGDTLKMTLSAGAFFEDCDVSLDLSMTNSDNSRTILGCRSGTISATTFSAVNGQATIWLTRKAFDDISFWFEVTVTAVKTEAPQPAGGTSSADVGLIAGVTAGTIVLLLVIILICICCYRKHRQHRQNQPPNKIFKNSDRKPTNVHGYENNMVKLDLNDSYQTSPGSNKKLLSMNSTRSDDTDGKPKSALDRFGYSTAQKQPPNNGVEKNALGRGKSDVKNVWLAEKGHEENIKGQRSEYTSAQQNGRNQISPPNASNASVLASLHGNSKFRKSFHENEVDAEDRFRRLSDRSSLTETSDSLYSHDRDGKSKLPPLRRSPPRSPQLQGRDRRVSPSPPRSPRTQKGERRVSPSPPRSPRTQKGERRVSPPLTPRSRRDGKFSSSPNRDQRSQKHEKVPSSNSSDLTRDEEDENEYRNKKANRSFDSDKRSRKDKLSKNESRKPSKSPHRSQDRESRRFRDEEDAKSNKRHHSRDDKDNEDKTKNTKMKQLTRSPESDAEDGDRPKQEREREGEYEGRFKKSASGRKPKGKGQRIGRSKSTSNALDDLDSHYQPTMSKSSNSVRSLTLTNDDRDDADLDSNYTFKRSGSKTSLYASRSSLYGRRRKNSMGETLSMSSYMYDDVDSRMGDFDKSSLSHKESERLFKSTGDLNVVSTIAVVLRECATQTGSSKEVYVFGRRTQIKSKHRKRYSRSTQTSTGQRRRDSVGSAKSERSTRLDKKSRSKSKSQESLRKGRRSRSRDFSEDGTGSERSNRRRRSKHQNKSDSESDSRHTSDLDSADGTDSRKGKSKHSRSRDIDADSNYSRSTHKSKSNSVPRKSKQASNSDSSDISDDRSAISYGARSSSNHQIPQPMSMGPQFVSGGYPMVYPQGYVPMGPAGTPVVFPVGPMPQQFAVTNKPATAPKPTLSETSKWDQLVNLTEGMKKRRHQMGESIETESVLSSTWSQPATYVSHSQVYGGQGGSVYGPGTATRHQREQNFGFGSNYTPSDSNV